MGLKRKLLSFLIMFLIAFSLGLGFYYLIKFVTLKKHKRPDFTIPLSDVDGDLDVVHALLSFHAADYFVYKGVPIGFQYEMLNELEKGIGRTIDIKVEATPKAVLKQVDKNTYDIVIMDFTPSGFILPQFDRSIPHSYSYPVLVSGNRADTAGGKPILVSYDFSAILFFSNDSPYNKYTVQKRNELTTEELFEKVDNNEIPYLICDYNEAITLMPFYSNVKILENAGPKFERRWFLNRKNIQLNEDINHWLLDFKKTSQYRWLLRKYFSKTSSIINASFASKEQGDISQYDEIIKKYAQQHEMDWRFIASIICQESKFTSGLTGKGGSSGLMQLMPATMEYYGISELDDDDANIRAGAQHLNDLRKFFYEIEDENEKLYFIAAAYNAGRGHIFDAQRLCAKFEGDYTNWKEVAKYLILKSQQKYATDSVVKSGYFPGIHSVKYAQQVMERYSAYKIAYP